jgi:hypothetical protein
MVFGKDGVVRLIDAETGKEKASYDTKSQDQPSTPLFAATQIARVESALSMKIGTRQKVFLIPASPDFVPAPYEVAVTAHETIAVPAGIFDCAKIETTSGEIQFYGLGDTHPLVKIDSGPVNIVLVGEFDWDGKTPTKASSKNFGVSFTVPGAMLAMSATDNKNVYRQPFWSADFAGLDSMLEINWTRNLDPEAKASSRACAEHMIQLMGKGYKEWGVVEGSWEKVDAGGIPGVAVRTRGVRGEITEHKYHVYALGKEKTVIFRMNYGARDGDAARKRAMELIKTLKWDQ